jgi:dihydroorotate dehydrogenase
LSAAEYQKTFLFLGLSSPLFMIYQLLRKFLFLFDAEAVHHFVMNFLRLLCGSGFKKFIAARFTPAEAGLSKDVFGLRFRNPVGLAAGFDKNALYLHELQALGFGFVETGTVTPGPQAGNDKPRLFRLPKDKALINRMGFNNDGVKIVAKRLKEWRNSSASGVRSPKFPAAGSKLQSPNAKLLIGGNIGKNKTTPNEEAWKDYEICFRELLTVWIILW